MKQQCYKRQKKGKMKTNLKQQCYTMLLPMHPPGDLSTHAVQLMLWEITLIKYYS